MPRIKTELLQEGMVVANDVKNSDNMLLIPSGNSLTPRLIGMLQSWGVTAIDVKATGDAAHADPLTTLAPEVVDKLTAEVKATFWKADDADPVFSELFKIILRRRAVRSISK